MRTPVILVATSAAAVLVAGTVIAVDAAPPADAARAAGATPVVDAASADEAAESELFDDFSYAGPGDPLLAQRSWTVRDGGGGPGVPGAQWASDHVSFPMADDGGQVLELKASTEGPSGPTTQSEVHHQRKFFEGTYAARVRFTDAPTSGPDGDQAVQTFFTITPLDAPMDPDYGELDLEYLPNGGWGQNDSTLFMTTWETYQPDPWIADNAQDSIARSMDGWHDLVIQVAAGRVTYYLDGTEVADHGGEYYPETPMSINFNHWFIDGGLVADQTPREYLEQVDYVYFAEDEVVAPDEVTARVQQFRADSVGWVDTVAAG